MIELSGILTAGRVRAGTPAFSTAVAVAVVLMLAACGARSERVSPGRASKPYGSTFRTIAFETDEGTAMNVDVSPDGKEIIFDLLGDIYTLPIEGGRAKPVIEGRSWDTAPRYSPDGTRIVFVSDRGNGPDALWLTDREGKTVKLLTVIDTMGTGRVQLGSPVWSADGREVAVRWGLVGIGIVNAGSGEVKLLATKGADTSDAALWALRGADRSYCPSFSPDGRYVFLNQNASRYVIGKVVRIDRMTNERTVLTLDTDTTRVVHEYRPVVSRTGRWLAYVRYGADRQSTLRLRDLESGEDRQLLALQDGDDPYRWADDEEPRQNFAFTPHDSAIVLSMNGKLWRIPLHGGPPRAVAFRATVSQQVIAPVRVRPRPIGNGPVHIRGIRAPTMSPDGRTLIFTAVGKLWRQDLESGRIRRLTQSEDGEYNAAISPDGRWVAYLSYRDLDQKWTDSDDSPVTAGRVMLLRLDRSVVGSHEAAVPRPLTVEPGDYGAPVWFPDGVRILFTRSVAVPGTALRRELFVWTDTSGMAPTVIGPGSLAAPGRVNSRRGARVSADGTRLYYVETERGSQGTTNIVSMRLDGSDRRSHVQVQENVTIAAIAPNGRHAVIARPAESGVYLMRVPGPADSAPAATLAESTVRWITSERLTSAFWLDDTTAIYATGPTLSRINIRTAENAEFHAVDLSLPRARPTGTLAIRGSRIVTMAGALGQERVIERGTIVVRAGRIAAVDAMNRVSIPADATVIDGAGLTIMPGLIDVHLHIGMDFHPRPSLDPDDISSLAYGVTTRYDPSTSSAEADLEHHEKIEMGTTVGPRYYYSGPALANYSGYPVPTLDAARNIVARYDAFGVVEIKEAEQPTRRARQYLAQAAAERGVGITGHLGGLKEALTRAADGFTAIEHSPFIAPVFKDVATFLARSGVNFTPTIIVGGGIDIDPQGYGFFFREMVRETPHDTLKYFRFRWPEYFRRWLGDVRQPQRFTFEQLRLGRCSRGAAAVIRAGGTVSIGAHNPPGLFTHWEMWAIQRGGASPMEVLRAGTINGAKKIGIDRDVGSLEVGKLADFIVLSANPLDDIRNTTKIRHVVADAVVYDGETMTRLWPTYQPLPRMGWQTPEEYAKLRHAPPLNR